MKLISGSPLLEKKKKKKEKGRKFYVDQLTFAVKMKKYFTKLLNIIDQY